MKRMRALLSFLMVTLLMVGMFAGCSKAPSAGNNATTPTDNTEATISQDPVGSLMVNAGAIVELFYNAEGLIVDAEGKNSEGINIMDNDPQLLGVTCADAMAELLPHFMAVKGLEKNNNAVLLKSTPGSDENSETFMADITAALEKAAQEKSLALQIFAVSAGDLNANGEMTVQQAKEFLFAVLNIKNSDDYSLISTSQTIQGSYAFQITLPNVTENYQVNAMNGDIMDSDVDDSFFDGNTEDFEEEELPVAPEGDDNNAEPTEGANVDATPTEGANVDATPTEAIVTETEPVENGSDIEIELT